MSYDLYFFEREKEKLKKKEVVDYFQRMPNFNVNHVENGDIQIYYNNEDTGVYFVVDYIDSVNREDGQTVQEGFFDAGLTFNINFNRPTFFALEAMQCVVKISKDLSLFILNPQMNGEEMEVPQKYTFQELIESWTKSNTWAVGIYKEKGELLYLPYEESMKIWTYQKEKSLCQERLGDDYFVPSIFVARDKGSNKLLKIITWNQAIPQVVPECDYILILREKKKFFGIKKDLEKGIVKYETLIKELDRLLEPFDGPIEKMKILHPYRSPEALSIFNNIKIQDFEFIEGVGMDGFIDV